MVQPLEEQFQAEMGARLNPRQPRPEGNILPTGKQIPPSTLPSLKREQIWNQMLADDPQLAGQTMAGQGIVDFFGGVLGGMADTGKRVAEHLLPPYSTDLDQQSFEPWFKPEGTAATLGRGFVSAMTAEAPEGPWEEERSPFDAALTMLDVFDPTNAGGDILKMGPEIFGSMARGRGLINLGWMSDPKSQERIRNMAEKGITWPQGQTRKIGNTYYDETGRELGYTGNLSSGWPSQGGGARRTSEAELAGEGAEIGPQNFYGRAAGQLNRHPFESTRSHWRRTAMDGEIETAELINQVIGWKSYSSPQDLVTKNTKNFDEIAKDLREGFHRTGPFGENIVNGKFTSDFIKSKEDLIRRNEELLRLYREGTIGPGDVNTAFTLLRNSFVYRGEGLGDPIKIAWSPSLQEWGKYERGFFNQVEAITREKQSPKLPNLSWGEKSTTSSERLKNMTPEQRLRFKRIQEESQEMLDDDYPTTGY